MDTKITIEDDPLFVDPDMVHTIGSYQQYVGIWPHRDVQQFFQRAAILNPKAHYFPRKRGENEPYGYIAAGIGEELACSVWYFDHSEGPNHGMVTLHAWIWTGGRNNSQFAEISYDVQRVIVPPYLTAPVLRVDAIELVLAIQDGKPGLDFIDTRTGMSLAERKTPPRKAA